MTSTLWNRANTFCCIVQTDSSGEKPANPDEGSGAKCPKHHSITNGSIRLKRCSAANPPMGSSSRRNDRSSNATSGGGAVDSSWERAFRVSSRIMVKCQVQGEELDYGRGLYTSGHA